MSNDIVLINVSRTVAPTPIDLLRKGACVTQGGTTLSPGTLSAYLTEMADLTAILAPAKAITSMAWSGNVVTVTTTAAHGWTTSDVIQIVIAGVTPAAYNGTVTATITGTSTFTYALTPDPGSVTIQGTAQLQAAQELQAMGTTFFAQGTGIGFYVLELGEDIVADGITAFGTWLAAHPKTIYRFLIPRAWDAVAGFLTLCTTYDGISALTYFHVTTTNSNYTSYTALQKSVMAWIEAPGIPVTEFSAAADFYVALNYKPSASNKVPPNAFSYVFGVTPYPIDGSNTLFAAWKAAGINWVGTGAEGGISTAIVFWGTMKDGNDLTYWYAIDWAQLYLDRDEANEIINGSNNPQNPLYYDQNGINRLQARAQSTMNSGVSFGLLLSPVVVTATSFVDYVAENPEDYPAGIYNGIAVTFTPNRGFKSITINVQVSDIPLA